MIYSVSGVLTAKKEGFVVVEAHGVGYKVFVPARTYAELAAVGEPVSLFCHFHAREDAHDLYGFARESELSFFEKLLTVSGVGPRSGLAVMALAPAHELAAAINEGKPELLTRAAGVGRKTAERIILELRGKLPALHSEDMVRRMESDIDVEEALVGLGYSHMHAKKVMAQVGADAVGIEARLRAALKLIKIK